MNFRKCSLCDKDISDRPVICTRCAECQKFYRKAATNTAKRKWQKSQAKRPRISSVSYWARVYEVILWIERRKTPIKNIRKMTFEDFITLWRAMYNSYEKRDPLLEYKDWIERQLLRED